MNKKVAILVDGGFYRKQSFKVKGELSPEERATELYDYCWRHLAEGKRREKRFDELYRIFYYDCSPISKRVYDPLKHETVDFSKSSIKEWTEDFFQELSKKRKVALRFGELSEGSVGYSFNIDATKKLLNKSITVDDVKRKHLKLSIQQKGVDMRIGLDIASLSFKKQVDKIILIAGDSDFVPAAKLARREGIDFVLDPLGNNIKSSLALHIDGLRVCDNDYSNYFKK